MHIINRYIISEILKPFFLTLIICSTIIIIYNSYHFLQLAATGAISEDVLIPLILLKIIIAMEVLIPLSLYLSIIFVLNRMYQDEEITAILMSGTGYKSVLRPIILLTLLIAVIVWMWSFFIRPWSYESTYLLESYANAEFDMSMVKAGNFFSIKGGNRVIYIDKKEEANKLKNVFIQSNDNNTIEMMLADEAYEKKDDKINTHILILKNGMTYINNLEKKVEYSTLFKEAIWNLGNMGDINIKYRSKSAGSFKLFMSKNLYDIAELQWRFTTPIMTIILGLLSIFLSKSGPRDENRYIKVLLATVIFTVYYNFYEIIETFVEDGLIKPIPGTFSVTALLFLLLLIIIRQQSFKKQ
jgi:lipopolysaccharide export system permease protein